MDRKRTQRILGILVIIALVIILFPLLFGKNDAPTQTTSIAPPLFPDQAQSQETNTAATNNPEPSTPVINEQRAHRGDVNSDTPESVESQPVEPSSANNNEQNNNDMSVTPSAISDTVIQDRMDTSPGVVLESSADDAQSLKTASPSETVTSDSINRSNNDSVIPIESPKVVKTTSSKTIAPKVKSPVPSSQATIAKLNSNAWAVQMGSFKNKENARVLADRLRSAGYKAFTKEVTSPQGSVQIRVYIGPEFKQASAIKINTEVQKLMNIQGMVVAYRPLAL